jgi:hypothetical protein
MAGVGGLPIAMDRIAPTALVPLQGSGTILSQLTKAASSAAGGALRQLPGALLSGISPENFAKQFVGAAAGGAAQQLAGSLVGNGVFVRPYAGQMDDLYAAFGTSSDPTLAMATHLKLSNSGYLPMGGVLTGAGAGNIGPVNMNNVLSQGAYDAVDGYMRKSGVTQSNPYGVFARDMTEYAIDSVAKAKPGDPIVITPAAVKARQSGAQPPAENPLATRQVPPLMAPSSTSPSGQASPSAPPARTQPPMVAAVTPTSQEMDQRNSLLDVSDKRIGEVQSQVKRTEAIKSHTHDVIDELNKLVKQAEEIRKKLDNVNAVPEITQVVVDLQSEIARQQQFIHTLDQNLDDLAQRRYELLKDRQAIVQLAQSRLQSDATRRVGEIASAAMNSSRN